MTYTDKGADRSANLADAVERLTRLFGRLALRAAAMQGVCIPTLQDDGSEDWRELREQVCEFLAQLKARRVSLDEAKGMVQALAERAVGPMPQVEFAKFLDSCCQRVYDAPGRGA